MQQYEDTYIVVREHIYSSMRTIVVEQLSCLSLSCNKKIKNKTNRVGLGFTDARALDPSTSQVLGQIQVHLYILYICKCPYVIQVDSCSVSKAQSARCFTDARPVNVSSTRADSGTHMNIYAWRWRYLGYVYIYTWRWRSLLYVRAIYYALFTIHIVKLDLLYVADHYELNLPLFTARTRFVQRQLRE